jgi:hypothetical protein
MLRCPAFIAIACPISVVTFEARAANPDQQHPMPDEACQSFIKVQGNVSSSAIWHAESVNNSSRRQNGETTAQGWRVCDIVGPHQIREHSLPPFATVVNGQVTYSG